MLLWKLEDIPRHQRFDIAFSLAVLLVHDGVITQQVGRAASENVGSAGSAGSHKH